jgi:hypothetical protein
MAFVGLWGYSNLLHHHMRAPSTRIIRHPFHASFLRPNPIIATVSNGLISRSITQLPQYNWIIEEERGTDSTSSSTFCFLRSHRSKKGRLHARSLPVSILVFGFDSIVQLIMFPGI